MTMDVQLTAQGQGYYRVFVNGAQVSQHVAEREASEAAVEAKLNNPAAAVEYSHDYSVTVDVVQPTVTPPDPPVPPPSGGAPVYDPALHVSVFRDVDTNPYYVSATEAGKAVITRRFIPHGSPATISQPVNTNELSIVDGPNGKELVATYLTSSQQVGPSWITMGGDYGPLPVTAEHYWHARMRLTGTPASQASKFMRLSVQPVSGPAILGGGMPQWSLQPGGLPYQGILPANVPCFWAAYTLGFTDEHTPYPDGRDQGLQPVGPYFHELLDGQPHEFVWGFKGHSAPGVLDGFMRMYIDGTKIIDVSLGAVGVTPPGGFKQWCGIEMVKRIPVAVKISEGLAIGGVQYRTNQPVWSLATHINSFHWWAKA